MSKISVIIPVYNAENQIEKCLDSLLKQITKVKLEILIINDESEDDSEKVILNYIEQHKWADIKYFSKKNEGVSKARNFGIEKATGEYLLFVDADDYISQDTVEKLEPYIEQGIDMIKFKMQKVSKSGKLIEKIDGPVFDEVTGEEAFNILYSTDVLLDSACIYLIKRDLFIENGFSFKRRYHEDFGLIPLIMVVAKSVVSLPDYCYQYVQVENSITRNDDYSKTLERMENALGHYDNMIETIQALELKEETKENMKIYYTNAIILKLNELERRDKKFFIKEIKKRKMQNNIKARNFKQLIKKIVLKINIRLYLKMR